MTVFPELPRDGTVITQQPLHPNEVRGRRVVTCPDPNALIDHWARICRYYPAACVVGDDEYRQKVEHLLQISATNTHNSSLRAPMWASHLVDNLPLLWRYPTTRSLDGSLGGVPAILVGAGPSLDKYEGVDLRSRGIVVAVNAATRAVAHHFALTMESNDLGPKFQPGQDAAAVVMTPQTNPAAARGRPILWAYSAELGRLLGGKLGVSPYLSSATAMTTAYSVVRDWGCDPIILIGNDMAFTDRRIYGESTGYGGRVAEGKEGMLDMQWSDESRALPRPGNPLPREEQRLEVTAWGGEGTVETMPTFVAAATMFAKMAASGGPRHINATGGGMRVHGWEELTPEALLKELVAPRLYGFSTNLDVTRDTVMGWVDQERSALTCCQVTPDAAPHGSILLDPWCYARAHEMMVERRSGPPEGIYAEYVRAGRDRERLHDIIRTGAAELLERLPRAE